MSKRYLFTVLLVAVMIPAMALAQGTITGSVTDGNTGDALPGANVIVDGQPYGGASDLSGAFVIEGVPAGTYTVTASVIGYESVTISAQVASGIATTMNFALTSEALEMSALEVVASRANRETPVAYTDVAKEEINLRLGSRDIPLVLTTTPSVYATEQGGGAGDARVNVRGFNQRNVAIMINGVPINDMENGWVYWSNWDGVADATSSIQMQRGLSAVNLAAPSIGGTMNILTDPATHAKGGVVKQELGDGGFMKTTASYHTGMVGPLALSGTIVRKTGDGVIDKAWTDAWAYYFGASYALSDKNRFELYALGAPQRHGQMRYAQNIAAFDSSYAKGLDDYDEGGIAAFPQSDRGQLYNENWNTVSESYTGQQYFYMYGDKTVDRHASDYLNESENYYHKPQVNLNWYLTLNDMMRLSSIFYFSGGSGGGTGTFDDMMWDYSGPSRAVDFDATIEINEGTVDRKGNTKAAGQSVGYLRNSVNRQWTVGAISKLNINMSDALKLQVGLDWRTAEIEHTREVRDLLGGTYAVNADYDPYSGAYKTSGFYNEFDHVYNTDGTLDYDATFANASGNKLGDNINYNNTNTVDWLGFFGQAEYKVGLFSVYGMGGYSMVKYGLTDHFKMAENYSFDATDDGEVLIESDWQSAIQAKGGGLFKVTSDIDVFANVGYVQKVPILDNVIDDINVALAKDPSNEKFISTEFGLNMSALNGMLATKFNYYLTDWKDRSLTRSVTSGQGSSGDTDIIFLTGVNQHHTGFEAEIAFQPMRMFRLDIAASIGNWTYDGDADGTYKDIVHQTSEDYSYALDGLKVGDMPQTIYALTGSLFPVKGLALSGTYRIHDNFYSNWDPGDREFTPGDATDPADRADTWIVPAYNVLDIHGTYDLPIKVAGFGAQVFFHMFNALDEVYVSDALDNSSYNAYSGDGKNHKADDAEVYFGSPRRSNFGLAINF